jgi:hypothetical protein
MLGTGFSSPLRRARLTIAVLLGAIIGIAAAPASASVSTAIGVGVSPFGNSTGAYYIDDFSGPQMVAVTILRNGAVIASQTNVGFPYLGIAPAVGDTVQLEYPPGTPFETVVYDGKPTIDPSTCIGATTVSGQRSDAGQTIYATAYVPNPVSSVGSYQEAQITTLSGTSYAGIFPRPLASGDYIFVDESEVYSRAYGSFVYDSSVEGPVGGCPKPAPPPPLPAAPGPVPPKGSITIRKARLRAFLRKGLTITVTTDQAGKVAVNMFLTDGKLPAKASSLSDVDSAQSKRRKKRGATLIGRGTANATRAGKVKVVVRPTKKARRLRHKRRITAAFLTTLSNTAGQATTLPKKRLSLKR